MNKVGVYSHGQLNDLNLNAKFDLIYISDSDSWLYDYKQVKKLAIKRNLLWVVADDIDDLWLLKSGVKNNWTVINAKQLNLIRQFIKRSLLTKYPLIVSCTAGISRSAAVGWYSAQQTSNTVLCDFITHYQNKILPNVCWYLLLNKYKLTQDNWNKINNQRYSVFNLERVNNNE